MSRNNFEDNRESLMEGVLQVLGKSPLPPPTKSSAPCNHESDGFIYDKTSTYVLLTCSKCGEQYEQPIV